MAVKVDMEQVCSHEALHKFGFNYKLIQWIRGFVVGNNFFILLTLALPHFLMCMVLSVRSLEFQLRTLCHIFAII